MITITDSRVKRVRFADMELGKWYNCESWAGTKHEGLWMKIAEKIFGSLYDDKAYKLLSENGYVSTHLTDTFIGIDIEDKKELVEIGTLIEGNAFIKDDKVAISYHHNKANYYSHFVYLDGSYGHLEKQIMVEPVNLDIRII